MSRTSTRVLAALLAFAFHLHCGGSEDTLTSTAPPPDDPPSVHLFLDDGDATYDDIINLDDVATILVQDTLSSDGTSSASIENPWYWLDIGLQPRLDDGSLYDIVIHSAPFDPTNLENISALEGAYCWLDGVASNEEEVSPSCEITTFSLSANTIATLTNWDDGDTIGTISYTVEVTILDERAAKVGSLNLTAILEDLEWSELVPSLQNDCIDC